MGVIFSKIAYESFKDRNCMRPIVFCYSDEELDKKAVGLNLSLSKELITIEPQNRSFRLESCLQRVLSALPEGSIIKDFDVLFNPAYKIDVLKVLIDLCKVKNFDIIWPGSHDYSRLIYAEEGYDDYKTYNISDYDITCVF